MAVLVIFLFLVGLALVAGGIVLLVRRGAGAGSSGPRVPVPATVVRQVGLRQPPVLEVDYPAPDGRPLRGHVSVPMSAAGFGQALLTGGSPTTVWVDPRRPEDISLQQSGRSGSGRALGGALMLFFGLGALFFGAMFSFLLPFG
ncbi:DUF3592 domain-containing protein [Georgenia yuyongxinii]|uniref:DUF3592 domain-containing protein n=1 Tax=Georgenia yuyongxinii TaxID=2589797 RepID=A0A552WLC3_9MICO|nr:DUF3592 domain-containing protein [Georgenia yuyongxinii]TRW43536.1 DUF3592 domain-containing protein [Georgenia yuyongxinii]